VPVLAEFGLLGPVNCSGHPPLGHSDLRLATVFMTWSQSICCALLLYHTRAQRIHKGHGEKFSTENEIANKVMQWTHLLVNSDWNSSTCIFAAKLGGLEALP